MLTKQQPTKQSLADCVAAGALSRLVPIMEAADFTPAGIADLVNLEICKHMGVRTPKEIPLKTQLEMARGALGRSVNKEEARNYIDQLAILVAGENKLKGIIDAGWQLNCARNSLSSGGGVTVAIWSKQVPATEALQFSEPWDVFPSDTLITKIMLVAGG